jgi:hypothetical protein
MLTHFKHFDALGLCMQLSDFQLDGAYVLFEEMGPDKRMPRRERFSQAYPVLASDDVDCLLGTMEQVSKTVWSIASSGAEPKMGRQKMIERLQKEHPFLRDCGLAMAISLANYYAWHEGHSRA